MADEVIIEEYQNPAGGPGSSIGGTLVTTQVVDIGTLSAAMNANTDYVIVRSKGTGFWFIVGGSTASAAADTNGNLWLDAGQKSDPIPVNSTTYIDTAADA